MKRPLRTTPCPCDTVVFAVDPGAFESCTHSLIEISFDTSDTGDCPHLSPVDQVHDEILWYDPIFSLNATRTDIPSHSPTIIDAAAFG